MTIAPIDRCKHGTPATDACSVCAWEEEPFFHATPKAEPCTHDFPDNGGRGPEFSDCCAKCGMTFSRHVFTECP